jgi:hypothetical protein
MRIHHMGIHTRIGTGYRVCTLPHYDGIYKGYGYTKDMGTTPMGMNRYTLVGV